MTHMHMHVHTRQELMSSSAGPEDKKVDVLLQREQTITEVRQCVSGCDSVVSIIILDAYYREFTHF